MKTHNHNLLRLGLLVVLSTELFYWCTTNKNTEVAVTDVTVTPVVVSIETGKTAQLTATIQPDNATNKTLTWQSSKTEVATVDSNGLITGITPGTATVTTTTAGGSITRSSTVIVTPEATPETSATQTPDITVSPGTAEVEAGKTTQLTATAVNGAEIQVTWGSDKPEIATVDTNGLVTAVAPGTATITATTADGAKTAISTITVPDPLDDVYTSDKPYPLTIVYFIPSDVRRGPLPDYKRRISEYLAYQQEDIRKWMRIWNLDDKTFGLIKNHKGEVEINVVMGKHPTAYYPYGDTSTDSGEVVREGAQRIRAEVEEWLKANPEKQTSNHVFVLSADPFFKPLTMPYYGSGQWAYAADFPYMELRNVGYNANAGRWGARQQHSKWIGANYHEMLHGLGIPHDGGLVSHRRQYGIPIMAANGFGFSKENTYLTPWDCALLSIGQTFNTENRTDWYQPAYSKITEIYARYDDASRKIIVSGKFTSSKKVLYVGFTNDAKRSDADRDYDSENWIAIPTDTDNDGTTDSFSTEMSIDEFDDDGKVDNIPVTFRISFLHENGTREGHDYNYQWVNGKPDIQFGDVPIYDRSKWTATASSQQSSSGRGSAAALLDGDINTGWLSQRTPPTKLPQDFTIDMGEELEVSGFSFGFRNIPGKLQDITIETSNDNKNWTELGKYTLTNSPGIQYVKTGVTTKFRYFKVTTTSASGNSDFATCQEVGAYKD